MKISLLLPPVLCFMLAGCFASPSSAGDLNPGRPSYEIVAGYSIFHLQPDVKLHLYGGAFEARYLGIRKPFVIISDKISHQKEISASINRLQGDELSATSIDFTYGKRINLPWLFLSFGIGPGTCYLFTGKDYAERVGYTLKDGLRLLLYYQFGSEARFNRKLSAAFGLKYNFTVRRFYLHNPFRAHTHEDLLNSFFLYAGVRWTIG